MDLRDRLQATLGDAFIIERELSGAGMSRVFVAEERALRRRTVVKVLPAELAEAVSAERFRREIQLVATLQHPNIVPVLRAGEVADIPFYIMPFVDGESLRAELSRRGRLPIAEAVRVLRDIASALAYAHRHHVVHRDIKPENVLLSSGVAVVTDFGIAKALGAATADDGGDERATTLTSLGVSIGTPAYMSPEQVMAEPGLDARSDIYSFGCVAYELLAGHPPFAASHAQQLLASQLHEKPRSVALERTDTPRALDALVMACLAKDAAERPQTADDIIRSLDDLLSTAGPSTTNRRRYALRSMALVSTIILVVLASRAARSRTGTAPSGVKSIALLPLATVGGDTASQWLADGTTEELTAALGKLSGVRVIPPTSASAAVARVGRDPQAIAKLLGVTALLEGSLRRTPRELRLTVRLVNASDGSMIWSQEFPRTLSSTADIFAVQTDIARKVAQALEVGLRPSTHRADGDVSLAAHDLYLRGRYLAARYNEADLRRAILLYDSASALEPRYPLPLAAKAEAWSYLADTWVAPRDAYPKANAALQSALQLDSTLADAYAVLANIAAIYYWNPRVIRDAASHALAHDSTSAAAVLAVASALMTTELDSSLVLLRLGERLDPLNPLFSFWAAATNFALGRPAEGCKEAQRGVDMTPGTVQEWMMAECMLSLKRYDDAAARLREPARTSPQIRALYARALALGGRAAEARGELAALERESAHRYVSGATMAAAYGALGDMDAAFLSLERAVNDRAAELSLLSLRPLFLPLQRDRRYRDIMKRMQPLEPAIGSPRTGV